MHFSVLVPHLNWVASPTALRDVAQAAEELGFGGLAVADHIHFAGGYIATGSRQPVEGGDVRDLYEALTTLAYLSAITTRVHLLPTVLVAALREPILAAKQLATIDVLSGGRLIVGVGVGRPTAVSSDPALVNAAHREHAKLQYQVYGVSKNRGRMTDEIIEAWTEIWTADFASYHGQHIDFSEVPIFPKPIQKPRPPLWVGGGSEAAMERVARYGDAWLPSQPRIETYRVAMERIRARAVEIGRPEPSFGINLFTSIADDGDAAVELTRDAVGGIFASPEEFRARTIAGDRAFWVERLRGWSEIGVTHVDLKPIYRTVDELIDQMRVLMEDVVPAIGDGSATARSVPASAS